MIGFHTMEEAYQDRKPHYPELKENEIPAEIKKWNWAAFLLNWIWGLGNQVYIALLCFIPCFGIFVPFYLGFKGNELAYRIQKPQDLQTFIKKQRTWALWSFIIFTPLFCIGGFFGSIFLFGFIFGTTPKHINGQPKSHLLQLRQLDPHVIEHRLKSLGFQTKDNCSKMRSKIDYICDAQNGQQVVEIWLVDWKNYTQAKKEHTRSLNERIASQQEGKRTFTIMLSDKSSAANFFKTLTESQNWTQWELKDLILRMKDLAWEKEEYDCKERTDEFAQCIFYKDHQSVNIRFKKLPQEANVMDYMDEHEHEPDWHGDLQFVEGHSIMQILHIDQNLGKELQEKILE